MQNVMNRLLQTYGQPAVLMTGGENLPVQVFFHSINSQSWQNMEHSYASLGRIPRGQYICVLPAGFPGVEGDSLVLQGREFEVRKLEEMYLGTQVAYIWGLCVERGA